MSASKKMLVAGCVVLLAGLAACGGAKWKAVDSAVAGMSLEIPEAWVFEESEATLTIADRQAMLDSETVIEGAIATFSVGAPADFGGESNLLNLVNMFSSFFLADPTAGFQVETEAAETKVNDNPAASIAMKGTLDGKPGVIRVMVISMGEKIVVALTLDASADFSHAATLARMVNSVKLSGPGE